MGTSTAGILDRVQAASNEVEELEEALRLARQRRDELIVAAFDEELGYKRVTAASRLSRARVIAIIARIDS